MEVGVGMGVSEGVGVLVGLGVVVGHVPPQPEQHSMEAKLKPPVLVTLMETLLLPVTMEEVPPVVFLMVLSPVLEEALILVAKEVTLVWVRQTPPEAWLNLMVFLDLAPLFLIIRLVWAWAMGAKTKAIMRAVRVRSGFIGSVSEE